MTYTTLRDGSIAKVGLNTLLEFDPASKEFPISTSTQKRPFTKIWGTTEPLLQGSLGACALFSICNELRADPVMYPDTVINHDEAVRLYFQAQRNDQYPGGEYPGAKPKMQGTSLLAGCKAAKKSGYIKGYRWAFSMRELKLGISYSGPAVIATAWTKKMVPDATGLISSSGGKIGGYHAYVIYGVDVEAKEFYILNSWDNWGINGTARITFKAMRRLMKDYGHAVFLTDKEITDEN